MYRELIFLVFFYNYYLCCTTFSCADGKCLASESMVCDSFADCSKAEDEYWCTGEKGAPGIPGDRGSPGPVGPVGPRGDIGDSGAPGEPGIVGRIGEKGNRNVKGPVGFPGNDGEIGPQGAKGAPGLPGNLGENGEIGLPGKNGPIGEPGPVGDPGEGPNVRPIIISKCLTMVCAKNEKCIDVDEFSFCVQLSNDFNFWGILGEDVVIHLQQVESSEVCAWDMKNPEGTEFINITDTTKYNPTPDTLTIHNTDYGDSRIYRCNITSTKIFVIALTIGRIGLTPCSSLCGVGVNYLALMCEKDIPGRSFCKKLSTSSIPCMNKDPCPTCVTCFGADCSSTFLKECTSRNEKCLNIYDPYTGVFTFRGCDRFNICELTKEKGVMKPINISGKQLIPYCN